MPHNEPSLSFAYLTGMPVEEDIHSFELNIRRIAALLTDCGLAFFAPALQREVIAEFGTRMSEIRWQTRNAPLLQSCSLVLVLTFPGFEHNSILQRELAFARSLGKQIIYMELD